MQKSNDSPGVYVPPPIIYAAIFLLSLLIQKFLPVDNAYFKTSMARMLGISLIIMAFLIALPAVILFIKTKNTLITIKPVNTLQTTGIYSISRNPMYVGLTFLYAGLSFLFGNWWTLMLLPLLIGIITYFVIRREERYLERAFGKTYVDYKKKVRRWV